ncbi:MAG TPA: hypothetical protein VHC22_17110 [Pirellulales bacterium]|nr:hypothetical protein [Pirellulales bacterium]
MNEPQSAGDRTICWDSATPFRLTIRGLLVCIFGVAFGLAEGRRGNGSFCGALLAALSAWAAIGLSQQACDLWRHFQGRDDLVREQRWGIRFAIGWRIGAILLWIAYYVARECEDAELLSLPERANWSVWFDVGRELQFALLDLLLLIAAGSSFPVMPRRPSRWSQVISRLAMVAGALLALLLYWYQMEITFLVHVACDAMEAARILPYRDAPHTELLTLTERYQPFIWGSAVAVCLSLFNLALLWRLAVLWPRLRWLKAALFAVGVLLMCAVVYRLATTAFPKACPYLVANLQLAPANYWILAAVIVGVALTASTYRLCARPWDNKGGMNVAWRVKRGYLHERMPWMILLAVATIGAIVEHAIRLHIWSDWFQVIVFLFVEPRNMLSLALFVFALARLPGALWGRPPVAWGVAALDPLQYIVVWCLSVLQAPIVIAAIASFSFAPWLSSWVF